MICFLAGIPVNEDEKRRLWKDDRSPRIFMDKAGTMLADFCGFINMGSLYILFKKSILNRSEQRRRDRKSVV